MSPRKILPEMSTFAFDVLVKNYAGQTVKVLEKPKKIENCFV